MSAAAGMQIYFDLERLMVLAMHAFDAELHEISLDSVPGPELGPKPARGYPALVLANDNGVYLRSNGLSAPGDTEPDACDPGVVHARECNPLKHPPERLREVATAFMGEPGRVITLWEWPELVMGWGATGAVGLRVTIVDNQVVDEPVFFFGRRGRKRRKRSRAARR